MTEKNILHEADRLTSRDRNQDYGHPYDDFGKTAKIMTVILQDILKEGCEVSREQVALCMIGVKLSRQLHQRKRDNLVDICGYARTLEMVIEKEEELNGRLRTDPET